MFMILLRALNPTFETQRYLDTVEALKNQVAQTGLQSDQAARLLAELRDLSVEMIENNPFEVASKTGTLEKINQERRSRIPNPENSAKQYERTFWSLAYLNQPCWQQSILFYDQEVKPLLETHYFRTLG